MSKPTCTTSSGLSGFVHLEFGPRNGDVVVHEHWAQSSFANTVSMRSSNSTGSRTSSWSALSRTHASSPPLALAWSLATTSPSLRMRRRPSAGKACVWRTISRTSVRARDSDDSGVVGPAGCNRLGLTEPSRRRKPSTEARCGAEREPLRPEQTHSATMIKVNIFMRRKHGLTTEDFSQHWRTVHAAVLTSQPASTKHIRGYIQCHGAP